MGNEASIMKKCTVGVKPLHSTEEWSLFDANYGSQQYSVFVFTEDQYFNDITRWKHIRHPNLVKCYEAGLHKGKKYILTEPVKPLRSSCCLEKLHNYSKLAGLYSIGEALAFLHQVCGISVNNFSLDSIFISRNDSNEIWKLGSLYWYSSLDSDSEEFFRQLISFHTGHGTLKTLPPEDREISTHRLIRSSKEVHRRDSYSFVNLVGEFLYDPSKPPKLSEMIMASESPPEMVNFNLAIKLFVDGANSRQPEHRSTVAELLNQPVFVNCNYLQIRQYFINFSTHSELEKFQFFQTFIERLRTLPDQLLIINIFSMIVSSRVIMSNDFIYNNVMPYLLIPLSELHSKRNGVTREPSEDDEEEEVEEEPNGTADTEKVYTLTNGETIALCPMIATSTYSDYIIPHIVNLFCVHDYKIRTLLLLYLPHYGSLISRTTLRKLILPQILLGIKDSNDQLVSLTFRSLAVLVDLFGAVAVFGGSKRSKHFASGYPRGSRLSSETSINDERDNLSTVSGKSSTSNNSLLLATNYGKMPQQDSHFILERSSPDGDEISRNPMMADQKMNHQANNNSSSNNLNLIEDDDDWPEWDVNNGGCATNGFDLVDSDQILKSKNESCSNNKMTDPNKSTINRTSTTTSKVQTFDIKDIDFKDVGNKNEIDNLFMDMEPVFDFRTKPTSATTNTQQTSKSTAIEEPEEQILNFHHKFQPKNEIENENLDEIGDNAWDNDDSFDLDDDEDNDDNPDKSTNESNELPNLVINHNHDIRLLTKQVLEQSADNNNNEHS